MSRKVIHESVRIFCDFCGNSVGKEETTIKLSGDNGEGSGPAYMSGTYDCCDGCYFRFTELVSSLHQKGIR